MHAAPKHQGAFHEEWPIHAAWALALSHELHTLPRRSAVRQQRLVAALSDHWNAAAALMIFRRTSDDEIEPLTSLGVAADGKRILQGHESAIRHRLERGDRAIEPGTCELLDVTLLGRDRFAAVHVKRAELPFTTEDARWLSIVHAGFAWIHEAYVPQRRAIVQELSPRERETLDHLLTGASEKEVAAVLNRSRHTVHSYVKRIYRQLGVSSRGELLSIFVDADEHAFSEPQASVSQAG